MSALNTTAMIDRVRREAAKRLLGAAITLQTAHRGDLSVGNPGKHLTPAAKGEYPRLRTGGLRANVAVSPASVSEVLAKGSVAVGYRTGGMHGVYLGGRGWKWVLDTYARERAVLVAILQGSP